MSLIPKITGNDKGIIAIIIVVLAIFFFFISRDSDAAEAEIGIGQAVIGSSVCDFQALTVGLRVTDNWIGQIATHGDDACGKRGEIEANIGLSAIYQAHYKKWTIGFGGGIWQHSDAAVGDERQELHLRAAIQIRRWFKNDYYGELLHFSSGGSMDKNPGMNFLSGGKAFGK